MFVDTAMHERIEIKLGTRVDMAWIGTFHPGKDIKTPFMQTKPRKEKS